MDMSEYAEHVAAEARGEEPWDAPMPFGHAKVPVFPAHRLPPYLNAYCCAVAESLQVPVDLPAMLVLSVLATAAGGRAVVEVRADWREPLNLYCATAMPPGSRKTPVFTRLVAPLESAEREVVDRARPEVAEAQVRYLSAKAQADQAEAEAGRAKPDAREEAVHYAAQLRLMADAITVPTMPRLLVDDATPEALTSLLWAQQGRLGMFSDEGEVFNMMAGRYSSSGPNLAVYLKAHVGSPIRVDRKGREAEYIVAPALTLGLTIQPSVLEALSGIDGARGRGLLGRFLWSVPPSNIGHRRVDTEPIPPGVEQRYLAEVVALVHELSEWTDPAVLVFAPEASAAVGRLQERLEQDMKPTGRLGHVADWASKLAGHVVRIAGLLHLAAHRGEWKGKAVDVQTVDDAIHIGCYLEEHALIAFEAMARSREVDDALALIGWIAERPCFTVRDAYRSNTYRFPTKATVLPALKLLEEHGYIRPEHQEPTTRRGRPPSTRYNVNPLIRSGGLPGHKTQTP